MSIQRFFDDPSGPAYPDQRDGEFVLFDDYEAEVKSLTASFEARIAELKKQFEARKSELERKLSAADERAVMPKTSQGPSGIFYGYPWIKKTFELKEPNE